jgi:heme exporter protein C
MEPILKICSIITKVLDSLKEYELYFSPSGFFSFNTCFKNSVAIVAFGFPYVRLFPLLSSLQTLIQLYHSIQYLRKSDLKSDLISSTYVEVGMVFAILGLITGSVWAKFTWGDWWTNDPKLNSVAIGLLIYLAYSLVRSSMPDEMQKARISSVYNIFAFVIFMVLIWILPRMTDSLHPGNGGNPAFSKMDLDNRMRMVFYPAIIGWTLLGYWIAQIRIRIKNLEQQNEL